MTMTYILDPVENRAARVTADNKLQTRATTVTQESFEAEQGEAYILGNTDQARTLTIAASFDGPILVIKNNDVRPLRIQQVGVSADLGGLFVYALKNPTIGTLANNKVATPRNLNFDVGRQAAVEAWVWDEVGAAGITGLTGGEEFAGGFLPQYSPVIFNPLGAVLLGSTDALSINVVGVATPQELAASIRFFFEIPTL